MMCLRFLRGTVGALLKEVVGVAKEVLGVEKEVLGIA